MLRARAHWLTYWQREFQIKRPQFPINESPEKTTIKQTTQDFFPFPSIHPSIEIDRKLIQRLSNKTVLMCAWKKEKPAKQNRSFS